MHTVSVGEGCPVCGQGRLLITVSTKFDELFVMCEDCESEWVDPDSAIASKEPTRGTFGFLKFASLENLNGHSWLRHVNEK
jgi:hypothetical protein